ncbi:DEAD/DEAH box helicase [Aminobacterium sp. MB27-C1]|uniref:DEAD/DEAH box helicase n=1 Tax=Aminobacterium sp. MB27-C1 TaxID=3070661 RepID=UPI0027DC563B|nr:DEAD/DEAH box helicase [Aminobacterium sp. MB27-C1]WMI72534.1 DEAD/DEAH box helicase [Aminobacterium sp. MB27-C1]
MPKIKAMLKSLKINKHFSQRICHVWQNSPIDAEYGPVPQDLDPKIVSYLQKNSISLYSHQAEGIKRCLAGENVIVTTPTASGKTMIFNLSVLNSMIKNKKSRAMYIYPRKALANDQMKSLLVLERDLAIRINPAIYDGDTPQSQKGTIRTRSRLIMTNPHELHYCLGNHYKWKKEFWENLEYIIIDEAHMYRGIFGSHIALLLRRIKRICNWYGCNPKLILSSATIANAVEFAEKLTQEDSFCLIDKSGAPESLKHFVLYNPFMEGLGYYLSPANETLRLFHLFVTKGLQTLSFVGSRKMAELIAFFSKGSLNKKNFADLADKVIVYKAGYTPG